MPAGPKVWNAYSPWQLNAPGRPPNLTHIQEDLELWQDTIYLIHLIICGVPGSVKESLIHLIICGVPGSVKDTPLFTPFEKIGEKEEVSADLKEGYLVKLLKKGDLSKYPIRVFYRIYCPQGGSVYLATATKATTFKQSISKGRQNKYPILLKRNQASLSARNDLR